MHGLNTGRGFLAILLVAVMVPLPVSASGGQMETGSVTLDSTMIDSAMPLNATVILNNLNPSSAYGINLKIRPASIDPASNQTFTPLASRWHNFTSVNSQETIRVDWASRPATPHLQELHVQLYEFGSGRMIDLGTHAFISKPHVILPEPSDFVVFGDSLSDQGNSYQAWGSPDSPPYWNGRFSDGPVWSEIVGQDLQVIMNAGRESAGGNNRAFGGAHSGDGYYAFVIPNAGKQIDDYTANNNFAGDEIVSLWIGGNDYLNSGETDTQKVVDSIEDEIGRLIDDGAAEIFIPNLVPLDKTPRAIEDMSESERSDLRARVIEHNQLLDSMLNETEATKNVTIYRMDAHSLSEVVVHRPALFDIVNVSDPACDHDGLLCSDGDPIAPNKHQYLFFDKVHPTTRSHEIMAMFAAIAMGVPDGDADGVADEDDQCPQTSLGNEVLPDGCDAPPPDQDDDGVPDIDDSCPNSAAGATVDELGCSADQRDGDLDGISDADDLCPGTPVGESVDSSGCSATERDGDADGVADAYDACPNTPAGATVLGDGCADMEVDRDGDGVLEDRDACPGTPRGEVVNAVGCGPSQTDADGDGISDLHDACPSTPAGDPVDESGCGPSQRDSDGDGIDDALDICGGTTHLETTDDRGCSDQQRDSDGDNRMDSDDDCPTLHGSLRGCPKISLSATLVEPPETPLDTAIIRLNIDCESNCSVLVSSEPWTDSSMVLATGDHLMQIEGRGHGSFEVAFRAEAEGTFATASIDVIWPEEVNSDTDTPPSEDDAAPASSPEVLESVSEESESTSNLVLLVGILGAANGVVLMALLKRSRGRRNRRRAAADPERLMDQTSLFR